MKSTKQPGFTIIEVLIVLILIAILVAVITPNYRNYVIKSNRSDAIKSIAAIQVAEEKYRLTNQTYGALGTPGLGWSTAAKNSLGGLYDMTVSNIAPTTYTVQANAPVGYDQNADTGCTTMSIAYANGTATKNTPDCWQ